MRSNLLPAPKPARAYAIVAKTGVIHLDKIMRSRAECWGLLGEEVGTKTIDAMRAAGWRCVEVNILPRRP